VRAHTHANNEIHAVLIRRLKAPSMSASARAAAPKSRPSPPRASSPASSGALLTREQDYAFGQPSVTRRKIRQLELAAGAPSRKGTARHHRLEGNRTGKSGRERDTGARIARPSKGKAARQTTSP